MKKRILAIFFASILLLFTSCSSNSTPTSATQARLELLLLLQNGDYKLMNDQLLSEQGTITEEEFEELRTNASNSNTVREFQLLSFDNGEVFLLEFTKSPHTDEYKIKNITVLSEDSKILFEDK